MNHLLVAIAVGVNVIAALLLYLASPHQRLAARVWPAKLSVTASVVLAAFAGWMMARVTGPATAVFIVLTVLMLLWTLVPLALAHRHHLKQRRAA